MRIWDVDPALLCRQHLLGEHRELHALWTILTADRRGYRRHPETLRWEGRLAALARRHELLVAEMERRGYMHHSPLDPRLATGSATQHELVDPLADQLEMLRAKPCPCLLESSGPASA
jgi:pyrimidine dimer DNA glycosylase